MHSLKSLILFVCLSLGVSACGGGGGGGSPKGVLEVSVEASLDLSPVAGAVIEIYNEVGDRVDTAASDVDGLYSVTLPEGGYSVRVRAQGYESSPPAGVPAVPVQVVKKQTTPKYISLEAFADVNATAYVSGNAGAPGVLVVMRNIANDDHYSAVADDSGDYVIYNLLPATYDFTGFARGFEIAPVTSVAINNPDMLQDLDATAQAGRTVSGQITFLSITNGVVDITLLHPETRDRIPGLSVFNTAGNTYTLGGVANGTYLAWATLANDGYVMDPDWIIKNDGIPAAIEVVISDANATQDFSVTGAVSLISPTNTAEDLSPAIVTSLTPTLSWQAYSSAGEYIIEVFDKDGNSIFGGYTVEDVGTGQVLALHPVITTTSVAISATDTDDFYIPLEDGETYRWRVSAVKVNPDHNLISASEDLMGVFTVQLP